jgi:hypothetical protein
MRHVVQFGRGHYVLALQALAQQSQWMESKGQSQARKIGDDVLAFCGRGDDAAMTCSPQ